MNCVWFRCRLTLRLTGTGTVVHPKVVIFGHTGPVVIGNNCIIEEGTVIINR